MGNTVDKNFQGTLAVGSADPIEDAEHITRGNFYATVRANAIGAAAEEQLVCVPQTDITITGFYVVSGLALAMDANNPTVTLAQGDLAAGSLTAVSSALDLSAALATRTKLASTISGTAAVTAGTGLYLDINTQGTPADISEDATLTFVIEYDLTN